MLDLISLKLNAQANITLTKQAQITFLWDLRAQRWSLQLKKKMHYLLQMLCALARLLIRSNLVSFPLLR